MKLLLVDWPKCRHQDRQTNTRSTFKLLISYPPNLLILPNTMVSCYQSLSSHKCVHINLRRVLNDRE